MVPPNHPILIGFSIINHPFSGTPIFGNIHIVVKKSGGETQYALSIASVNGPVYCTRPWDGQLRHQYVWIPDGVDTILRWRSSFPSPLDQS